ncbi:MAG: phosphodiester glycosidase family protein [Bacteroidetes bacterium]|nr:MAG: phosphodiester glycosidase family protein [Bacteroidota bacterium]
MKKIWILCSVVILFACTKNSNTPSTNPPVIVPGAPTPLLNLPAGWRMNTTVTSGFPASAQVFTFDSIYAGRGMKAALLVYDARVNAIEFKPVLSSTAKTTTAFFTDEGSNTLAAINGGFFGSGQSFSLVKYNGQPVASANIKSVTRGFGGSNLPYFPTRAAFGVTATGLPQAEWIYHVGAGNDNIFRYPNPSPNTTAAAPQPVPTETFPANGSAWNIHSAIGGSPMLIKDGTIRITDTEELISINNATSRPRSALGYTANNLIVLLAIEGDNGTISPGVNLQELATLLQSMGCTNAVNLDGGGSTSFIVGGTRMVRPGDAGVERTVMSAVVLKRR